MKLNPIKLNIQRFSFPGQYFEPRDMAKIKKYYDENDNVIHRECLFTFKSCEVNVEKKIINFYDDYEINVNDKKTKPIKTEEFDYIDEVDFNIDGIDEHYSSYDYEHSRVVITGPSDGTEKANYPYLVEHNGELYPSKCFFDKNNKLIISYLPSLGKIKDDWHSLIAYGKEQKQTIYQQKNKEIQAITTTDYNYQVYHDYEVLNPKNDEPDIIQATKKNVESIIRVWNDDGTITINYYDKNNRVLWWDQVRIGDSVSIVETSGDYAGYNVTIYYSAADDKVIWYEVGSKYDGSGGLIS